MTKPKHGRVEKGALTTQAAGEVCFAPGKPARVDPSSVENVHRLVLPAARGGRRDPVERLPRRIPHIFSGLVMPTFGLPMHPSGVETKLSVGLARAR